MKLRSLLKYTLQPPAGWSTVHIITFKRFVFWPLKWKFSFLCKILKSQAQYISSFRKGNVLKKCENTGFLKSWFSCVQPLVQEQKRAEPSATGVACGPAPAVVPLQSASPIPGFGISARAVHALGQQSEAEHSGPALRLLSPPTWVHEQQRDHWKHFT